MALLNSSNPATISLRDAGNEIGTVRLFGADIDAANLDAQDAKWDALAVLILAMQLGNMTQNTYINHTTYSTVQPTNGAARELKLLIQGQSAAGKKATFTIPCLDVSKVHYVQNINAKDVVLLSEPTAMTALITALNGFWVDENDNTDPMAVVGAKVVGRSN